MIRAFKIRLHPNNKQRSLLERSAHVARWAYNWALDQKKQHYEETKKAFGKAGHDESGRKRELFVEFYKFFVTEKDSHFMSATLEKCDILLGRQPSDIIW
jgi:transposase